MVKRLLRVKWSYLRRRSTRGEQVRRNGSTNVTQFGSGGAVVRPLNVVAEDHVGVVLDQIPVIHTAQSDFLKLLKTTEPSHETEVWLVLLDGSPWFERMHDHA
jgi:hypothetical protein